MAAVVELSVKSRKMVTITFASKEGYSRDNKREIYASANARKAGLFVGHQYPFLELDAVTPLGHFEICDQLTIRVYYLKYMKHKWFDGLSNWKLLVVLNNEQLLI